MKFPTTTRMIPELVLSETEQSQYVSTAEALVAHTLAQYDEYDRVYDRRVNKEQWKPVKHRESLTVFKERKMFRPKVMLEATYAGSASTLAASAALPVRGSVTVPTPYASSTKWSVPTLFMVGTIVGTLDDVMYGVATFDAPSMLLKTTYTHDELVDGEILNQIHGPTGDDPFRFLGLKWIVKGNPAVVSPIVLPRDLVFLESTGIDQLENGDRVGYHLMHSVDLPGYGPLQNSSILRGRVSSCIVFKELENGTVDVYMKANFEPNGKVGESVAVLSAANGLIYCSRAVYCAQHKKLAWLLRTRANHECENNNPRASKLVCATCGKPPRAYRHVSSCKLCHNPVCQHCRVTRKISFVGQGNKEIVRHPVNFCTSCVVSTTQKSALAIAREEVLTGRWDNERETERTKKTKSNEGQSRSQSGDTRMPADLPEEIPACAPLEWKRTMSSNSSVSESFYSASVSSQGSFDNTYSSQGSIDNSVSMSSRDRSQRDAEPGSLEYQEQLYRRIVQLQQAAESTYQIAMSHSVAHVSSSSVGEARRSSM
uniref:FYVE-type domain-containing protein n=1 Tax=Globisporangium ultimum (strain ATCC 200006 / CBS 805.95 / DAOM BR144) TaxID=431595 RepID=K3WRW2_GLOUD